MATPKKCACPNCKRDDLDGDEKFCPTCGLAVERAGNDGDWPEGVHKDSPRRPFKCDDDGNPKLPTGATHAPWEADPDADPDDEPAKDPAKPSKKRGWGALVLALLALAALAYGGYRLLKSSGGSPSPSPDAGTTDGGRRRTTTDAAVDDPPTPATWLPGQAPPAGWELVSGNISLGGSSYPLDSVPYEALRVINYADMQSGNASAGSVFCPSTVPITRIYWADDTGGQGATTLWVVAPGACIQRQ